MLCSLLICPKLCCFIFFVNFLRRIQIGDPEEVSLLEGATMLYKLTILTRRYPEFYLDRDGIVPSFPRRLAPLRIRISPRISVWNSPLVSPTYDVLQSEQRILYTTPEPFLQHDHLGQEASDGGSVLVWC